MSDAGSTNEQLDTVTRSDTNARSGTVNSTWTTRPSKLDGHIDLSDNTRPSEDISETPLNHDEDDELASLTKTRTSWRPNTRIKQELTKRKYAKYAGPKDDAPDEETGRTNADEQGGEAEHDMEQLKKAPTKTQNHLRRGQQKVIGILNPRRKQQIDEEGDTVIDVLYENQRGSWFFGKPLFSSNSLLNFDSASWTDQIHHPSPVDITNAQLPDPSWHWCWNRWYVDMSPDVDEQGWQYSFMFQNRFLWHGTHPWFHSFVRRRRWVRKRARGGMISVEDDADGMKKSQTGAHTRRLGADYFSVRAPQPGGPAASFVETAQSGPRKQDKADLEDFHSVQALLRKLKKLALDREKISAILEYIEQSGESLHDLADEVSVKITLSTHDSSNINPDPSRHVNVHVPALAAALTSSPDKHIRRTIVTRKRSSNRQGQGERSRRSRSKERSRASQDGVPQKCAGGRRPRVEKNGILVRSG